MALSHGLRWGTPEFRPQSPSPPVRHLPIDVINVREKIKKNVKNAFLIQKLKKTFVNVIK